MKLGNTYVARCFLSVVLLLGLALPASAAEPTFVELFKAGQGGYAIYRIPGLIVTRQGTLIAYCEARKTHSDWGEIDLLLRRSTDGGKTWSTPHKFSELPPDIKRNPAAVAKKIGRADKFTINNPVAIAGRDGVVHMLYCVEYARCFYLRSKDDGQTFSKPVEITAALEKLQSAYAWRVLATGPGYAIETTAGRLVVPVWLSPGTSGNAHHPSAVTTIYSDDQGSTWHAGEVVVANSETYRDPNETAIVELPDGRVMLNIRNESPDQRRLISVSADGATKWSKPTFDETLVEPICMASLVRIDDQHLVFANPANLLVKGQPGQPGKGRDRINLTLRLSSDAGQTWSHRRVLDPGASAYSDLAAGPDGAIYCLYEQGGYASLVLAKLDLAWLKGE